VGRVFGLDVHNRYVHGYEWHEGQGRHFRFANTPEDWNSFLSTVTSEDEVALEATGSAFALYYRIAPHVRRVVVANPLEMRRLGSGRHTDRVDAERLVFMVLLGTLKEVWVPPTPIAELRRLLQYRERIQNGITRLSNQIWATLRGLGVATAGGDPLKLLAQDDIEVLPTAERVIVLSALRRLETERRELAILDAEIARQTRDVPEVRLLLSIPGVGRIVAAQIYAALGDARRFRTPRQVARYAGLDPTVVQSGDRSYRGHISKNGSRLLRRAMVEAAHIIALHDRGSLREFYRRKVDELGYTKTIVALARKLLIVAWRVLVTGEPYRAVRPSLWETKQRQLTRLAGRVDQEAEAVLLRLPRRGRSYVAPVLSRQATTG
jgi:transposase